MKKFKKVAGVVLASSLLLTGCSFGVLDGDGMENPNAVTEPDETEVIETSIFDSMDISGLEPTTLVMDTNTRYQTMDGFGGAFTWYGDILAKAKNSDEGYDAFFTDAKLSIVRFKNEYNYNVKGKASNASAMANNYKQARDRAALRGEKITVLMSCWSPPAYLKSDNAIDTGTGTLKRNEDGEYMYKEYADWWVESIEYYTSMGVVIDYVSIQNEVDFSPESYEGCRFSPTETETYAGYDEAFIAVYDAFQEAFGADAPVLLGPETMSCALKDMLNYSTPIIEKRPEALGGLAYHLYVGGTSNEEENTVNVTSYKENFLGMETYFPDTKKWQTEFFVGQGLETAELIWSALTKAEMNAYIYWSAIWADSTPDRFDSADLMEINNSGEWRLSSKYYALRHYSEFIRPGYQRIDVATEKFSDEVCAFANDANTKIAMVIVNTTGKEKAYYISGTDYTIVDSAVYQSVYDGVGKEEDMYKAMGILGENGLVVIPANSVTTIDITGFYGDTEVAYEAPAPITYEEGVLENPEVSTVPTEDVNILNSDFSDESQVNAYNGFGSSIVRFVEGGGSDGNGCMIVKGRQDAWNGMALSEGYFEHYGYLVKVSYDVMMEEGGQTVSCTSNFTIDGSSYYPDGENNRVACYNMEAGKWYHCEGYVTMYSNMSPNSFKLYWESPDNTYDIYLDNIEVTILYTEKVGEFSN
ncbi:MAG: hypothetical protein MJ104_03590 [Lachnospiraceae bacterium]|nr:hypothetical protein [Lachnospiraceae bacterium]